MTGISLMFFGLAAVLLVAVGWRVRRRRSHIGPGAIGMVEEFLHQDKRKAVEIIVEGRAEATDPETADGNLPELEDPDVRGGRGGRETGGAD